MLLRRLIKRTAIATCLLMSSFTFAASYNMQPYVFKPATILNGNWYLGLGGGYTRAFLKLEDQVGSLVLNKPSQNFNNGVLEAVIGYKFDHNYFIPLRLELLGLFRPQKSLTMNPISVGSNNYLINRITTTELLFNAYWDFYSENPEFVPYIGAGIGAGQNRTKSEVQNITTNAFVNNSLSNSTSYVAWDIELGTRMNAYPNVDVNIFARLNYLGNAKFESTPAAGGNNLVLNSTRSLYAADIGAELIYNIM